MHEKILRFIEENQLSPFHSLRTSVKGNIGIFKTNDAKAVYTRLLSHLSRTFAFADSSALWQYFSLPCGKEELLERQEFFRSMRGSIPRNILAEMKAPHTRWRPPYGVLVVTEDENTYLSLKHLECPVKLLLNEQDVMALEVYEVVQVVDCEQYSSLLERLPQSVFVKSIDEVYLERFVIMLSGWQSIIEQIAQCEVPEVTKILAELTPLLELCKKESEKQWTLERAEEVLEIVNDSLTRELEHMTFSGAAMMSMMQKGNIPRELQEKIQGFICVNGLPQNVFTLAIPVQLDEQELARFIRDKDANVNTSISQKIKREGAALRKVPEKLRQLESWLVLMDFMQGCSEIIERECSSFPSISTAPRFAETRNLLLDQPAPISFHLTEDERCSILTGANSGGKTTLLEHFIQLVVLFYLGLPVPGSAAFPLFSEVYYFAKTKGSASKGAFETLLTQMAWIKPGKTTLILADEIEAVTEPGVAGKVVSATVKYFIERGCFLVVATHLGHEIQRMLPTGARIDGIEAKGLDEQFELIVDHNPQLGKLAHSTPELIIERLAKTQDKEYFAFLHGFLKECQ